MASLQHIMSPRVIIAHTEFERQYMALRRKEQRVYTDEEVRNLPDIPKHHPHYHEWRIRKQSSAQLVHHLRQMKRPLKLLEIGCGNGWLSALLAAVPGIDVTGLDINREELQQAQRVFGERAHLKFINGEPFAGPDHARYDVIVFAASIQYFHSLEKVVRTALEHLYPCGRIYIMDSHFYKPGQLPDAKKRTDAYYASLGFPGFSYAYFHHSLESLSAFNYRVLYDPGSPLHWVARRRHPFHRICIYKS
jgi:SAM-dependent methyltransferase